MSILYIVLIAIVVVLIVVIIAVKGKKKKGGELMNPQPSAPVNPSEPMSNPVNEMDNSQNQPQI